MTEEAAFCTKDLPLLVELQEVPPVQELLQQYARALARRNTEEDCLVVPNDDDPYNDNSSMPDLTSSSATSSNTSLSSWNSTKSNTSTTNTDSYDDSDQDPQALLRKRQDRISDLRYRLGPQGCEVRVYIPITQPLLPMQINHIQVRCDLQTHAPTPNVKPGPLVFSPNLNVLNQKRLRTARAALTTITADGFFYIDIFNKSKKIVILHSNLYIGNAMNPHYIKNTGLPECEIEDFLKESASLNK